jgi:hypothetical protein
VLALLALALCAAALEPAAIATAVEFASSVFAPALGTVPLAPAAIATAAGFALALFVFSCEVSSASILAATDSGVSPELLFADSGDGVATFVAAIPFAGFEAALVDAPIDGVAGCLEAGVLLPDAAAGSVAPDVGAPFMLVVTLMLSTGRLAAVDFAAADPIALTGSFTAADFAVADALDVSVVDGPFARADFRGAGALVPAASFVLFEDSAESVAADGGVFSRAAAAGSVAVAVAVMSIETT